MIVVNELKAFSRDFKFVVFFEIDLELQPSVVYRFRNTSNKLKPHNITVRGI